MSSGPITSWQIDGETVETVRDKLIGENWIYLERHTLHRLTILFWGAQKSRQMVTAAMKLKDACPLEKKL